VPSNKNKKKHRNPGGDCLQRAFQTVASALWLNTFIQSCWHVQQVEYRPSL